VDPRAFDVIVLPGGGKGAERLCTHVGVLDALRRAAADGRWTAAICAAPTVLQAAGLLEGRRVTSYPAFSDAFPGAHYVEDRVVVDGRIVTSRGPGTAFEFALALVEQLDGPAAARRVAEPMLLP
jgi:protein deglycase